MHSQTTGYACHRGAAMTEKFMTSTDMKMTQTLKWKIGLWKNEIMKGWQFISEEDT
jgi:hypothetical protein